MNLLEMAKFKKEFIELCDVWNVRPSALVKELMKELKSNKKLKAKLIKDLKG